MTTYASIGQRGAALILDSIIVGVIGIILIVILGIIGNLIGDTDMAGIFMLLGYFISIILVSVYFIALNGPMGGGQTYGKKIMKIKTTMEDGSVPSYTASVIRYILSIVDQLPFLYLIGIVLISTSDKNQRLGDRIAKTVVVKV